MIKTLGFLLLLVNTTTGEIHTVNRLDGRSNLYHSADACYEEQQVAKANLSAEYVMLCQPVITHRNIKD